jgi:hypothetical protein
MLARKTCFSRLAEKGDGERKRENGEGNEVLVEIDLLVVA